ncbi:hypothetical protein THAOC_24174 [Thalassiosira oceanica]|uniref:Uncharacterized protein n=1 Tax=Thalassiosira oceanica TaxID=159749 RepID=K0RSK6_THAOC|nr:hypothetical protein THAOC_24174 [Thalassiosira oceanica]|eukprot:EJK56015.1 hypothetical protein THAOC_24174 [Thalassiosira oceanica]
MKNNSRTHFVVVGCHLGVPEATFLFNTFRDMNSLEELCIDCQGNLANLNDDEMAGCIPSLAACTGMRSLELNHLNLSTYSFAALRGVFPRMATLRELVLRGNSLDDDCTRLLAQGLSDCNQIQWATAADTPWIDSLTLGPAMKSNNFTHFVVEGCYLGVPEATFLFNTFVDMNSLEELLIDGEEEGGVLAHLNDGDIAGYIPSLAACTGMQSLKLSYLNLSTNSCAALRGVFPQMTTLRELVLSGNSLDDDCTRLLAQGLTDCKQMQSLDLSDNRISDNGLEALIQGLPASVDALHLTRNDITLARHVLLLRFEVLNIGGNRLCPGGTGGIAASLADPECRLELLIVNQCNIGDEGTAILADGLRNNQRLTRMSLGDNDITERGWNAFSSILCDTASINATYNSNHTLQDLGNYRISLRCKIDALPQQRQGQEPCCGDQDIAGLPSSQHETPLWKGVGPVAIRDSMA